MNAGFEAYTRCPGNYSQHPADFSASQWQSANLGTPDYFHLCSRGDADVPHNWAGVSEAYDGDGYAGIYVWMNGDKDYREYLQGKLSAPLLKDSLYHIAFRYRLSSYSMYAVDRIGLLLTKTRIDQHDDRPIHAIPSVSVVQDTALTTQTGYWELLQQFFRASGEELYVTIGNFSDNASTRYYPIRFQPVQQEMLAQSAYYYIDGVSITPAFSVPEDTGIPPFTAVTAEVNKTFILKHVNFNFDSYRLDYASREELQNLAIWLKQNPAVTVILSGHTDDVGGDKYNLTLSRNRAKAVAEYLATQGVAGERIEYYGYGKSRPLINALSDEARKTNRRVEAKFVQ